MRPTVVLQHVLIFAIALALMVFCLSCAGTESGVRMQARGFLEGDLRTDGAGTWAAVGEANLVVSVYLSPNGPIVFMPIRVSKGRLWARAPNGETADQPISDPWPEWVLPLFTQAEIGALLERLQPPSFVP